jgi:uncharacterized membrane protein
VIADDTRNLKQIFFSRKNEIESFHSQVILKLSDTPIQDKLAMSSFKILLRNLFFIGQTVSNEKEFRDIFLNVMEKIVEPCVSFSFTAENISSILTAMVEIFITLELNLPPATEKRYRSSFSKLVCAVEMASVRLYQSFSSPGVFGF